MRHSLDRVTAAVLRYTEIRRAGKRYVSEDSIEMPLTPQTAAA